MKTTQKYNKYTWKEEYSSNIKFIDAFHQNFMNLTNTLVDVVYKKECKEKIVMVFHRLANYIEDYLVKEEMYLQKIGYKDLKQHRAEHALFISEITNFHKKYEKGNNICLDLLIYVDNYFKNHILKKDKEAINS